MTYEIGITDDRRLNLAEIKVATLAEQTKYLEKVMTDTTSRIETKVDTLATSLSANAKQITDIDTKINRLTTIGVVLWALVLFFKEPLLRIIGA